MSLVTLDMFTLWLFKSFKIIFGRCWQLIPYALLVVAKQPHFGTNRIYFYNIHCQTTACSIDPTRKLILPLFSDYFLSFSLFSWFQIQTADRSAWSDSPEGAELIAVLQDMTSSNRFDILTVVYLGLWDMIPKVIHIIFDTWKWRQLKSHKKMFKI